MVLALYGVIQYNPGMNIYVQDCSQLPSCDDCSIFFHRQGHPSVMYCVSDRYDVLCVKLKDFIMILKSNILYYQRSNISIFLALERISGLLK